MKQLTIFLFILTVFSAYGQDKAKETAITGFKSVQIGFNISPDICFRTLKNNDGSPTIDIILAQVNKREIAKVGYTAGLNVCFNANKFVGLETGIQYSNKGYQTKFGVLIFEQPEPNSPNSAKFIYNFHYIDIPVKANFTMGKKKVRLCTSVGITTNVFIKKTQTSVLVYSDHKKRKNSSGGYDYKKINFSPTISAGIDWNINSQLNLKVEPTLRYGVLKIIDAPLTDYLYSGGLNIACYYGLQEK